MPVINYQTFKRIVNLCHANVPKPIMDHIHTVKGDDQKVKEYGVNLGVTMIQELIEKHNVVGVHLTTLNLERSAKLILQRLQLAPEASCVKPFKCPMLPKSWDKFPNGRYGDARSLVFCDKYGAGRAISTTQAKSVWGYPTTIADIDRLFERYIWGDLAYLPWYDAPLQTETNTIRQRLADINCAGCWTVGYQPAVNGAKSEDPNFGWGPKAGYVYQKAYFECFVTGKKLPALLEKMDRSPSITYYAANNKGDFWTNATGDKAQNTVTWGVFPDKEIVQLATIERVNFQTWKQEAFDRWVQWEQHYVPGSHTAQLLRRLQNDCWLVNLVHNDFQQPNGLFEMILA